MPTLPITSRLLPTSARNLAYMGKIALLTRLATGVVRVHQNKPDKLDNPKLTPNQKRQAFWERFFVEIIGTSGYMFFLHLGQDLMSKVFERSGKLALPKITPEIAKEKGLRLTPEEIRQVNAALQDTYGSTGKAARETEGLIARVLYGKEIKAQAKAGEKAGSVIQKTNLDTVRAKLGNDLFNQVKPLLIGFSDRAKVAASLSVVAGVALSALYGGFVTQWLNDRVVAPFIARVLKKRYGDQSVSSPAPQPRTAPRQVPATPPRAVPEPKPMIAAPANWPLQQANPRARQPVPAFPPIAPLSPAPAPPGIVTAPLPGGAA